MVRTEARHSQDVALKLLVLVLVALLALAEPSFAQTTTRSVEVDGQRRSFLLHAPEAERARPLVMAFHGNGGTARTMERMTRFSDLADEQGFVVVYPMAAGNGAWRVYGDDADVRFVQAIVDTLAAEGLVDRTRIYGLGKSLGAQMTWRLACERPTLFQAVGLVAGGYPRVCGETRPQAIIFHGVRDEWLPYAGGDGLMALPDFARAWGAQGCAEVEGVLTNARTHQFEEWRCGENRAQLYTFPRSGHIYPTDREGGVDATVQMWRFFVEAGR